MISGSIYNAGKMFEMAQKWEQKKLSGTLLKKAEQELTPEERQLQMYQEQIKQQREGNEYSAIYAKIQSGRDLSLEEEEKIRKKDPRLYMEYKADQMEQEAYKKRLRECKTKEEAEKLHVNRMNGKLAELKSVTNNPYIPKGEKMKEAQRIMGDAIRTAKVFHEFTSSAEFKKLPTDQEALEVEKEVHSAEDKEPEAEQTESSAESEASEANQTDFPTGDEASGADQSENKNVPQKEGILETEKKILNEMFEWKEKVEGTICFRI